MKVWSEVQPDGGGSFAFEPAHRYAVLASVSRDYSLADVESKATSKGFQITYAWEQGQPSRATYAIDDWLASLAADPTSNHRWLYAEGNFEGASPWSLSQDPPWPFTLYHVAHVFEAVDAPDQPSGQEAAPPLPSTTTSAPSSSSSSWAPALLVVGGVLVAAGLGYWAGARGVPLWAYR